MGQNNGVLLLNTTLTVRAHMANSHSNAGWQIFTDDVIKKLNRREKPMVFILWGRNAINKRNLIDESRHFVLTSPHPSPLPLTEGFSVAVTLKRQTNFWLKPVKNL